MLFDRNGWRFQKLKIRRMLHPNHWQTGWPNLLLRLQKLPLFLQSLAWFHVAPLNCLKMG